MRFAMEITDREVLISLKEEQAMTKRYFIECAKCGVQGQDEGSWMDAAVVTAVKYRVDEKEKWLANLEVTGIPNFYIFDDDLFDTIITNADEDEEMLTGVYEKSAIDEFDGIKLGDYDEIEEYLSESSGHDGEALIRYVVTLSRCDRADEDHIIKAGEGKYADEVRLN